MYRRTDVYMSGVNISSLHCLEIQCGVFLSFLLPHSFNNLTFCCLETLVFSICRLSVSKWIPFIPFGITHTNSHTSDIPNALYTHTHIAEQMYFLPAVPPLFPPLSLLELLAYFLLSVHDYDLVSMVLMFGRSCAHCITNTNMWWQHSACFCTAVFCCTWVCEREWKLWKLWVSLFL
jgi:hypothetical protein